MSDDLEQLLNQERERELRREYGLGVSVMPNDAAVDSLALLVEPDDQHTPDLWLRAGLSTRQTASVLVAANDLLWRHRQGEQVFLNVGTHDGRRAVWLNDHA